MSERGLPFDSGASENAKPSRVERGRRPDRERRQSGDPVPSRAVHRRGEVVESVPTQEVETKEIKRLKELQVLIADRYERCSRLLGFIENGYDLNDSENFSETLIKDFHEGSDIVRRYLSDLDRASVQNPDFLSDMIRIEGLAGDFDSRLSHLQSIINDLEKGDDRLVVPDEIRALFDEPASSNEKHPFEEKIDLLETKLAAWASARKELLAYMTPSQYEVFIDDTGEVGALARGVILGKIKGKIRQYREAFSKGEEPNKREWDWLDRHTQGFEEVIRIGRAKLEELQKKAEMDSPGGGESLPENNRVPEQEFLQANELIARWKELCNEFGVTWLRKAIQSKHPKGTQLPYVPVIEGWLEDHRDPKAWEGSRERKSREGLNVRLRDLRGMVKDAESIAVEIRGEQVAVVRPETSIAESKDEEKAREEEMIAFLENRQRGLIQKLKALNSKEDLDQFLKEQTEPIDADVAVDELKEYLKKKSITDETSVQRICDVAEALQLEIKNAYAAIRERFAVEAEFSEKLVRVKELVQRWETLGDEIGFGQLKEVIREDGQGVVTDYSSSVKEWFEEKLKPEDWQGQDRVDLIERTLPEMEVLVARAEVAAAKLKVEIDSRANVTVLATRRKIESDEQMTSWEKMESNERQRFIRLLSQEETDGFKNRLNQLLLQKGARDVLMRNQVIAEAFEDYMPKRIRQLAPEWKIEITDAEIETLMVGLRKNVLVS